MTVRRRTTTALGVLGETLRGDEGLAMAMVVMVSAILFVLLTALVTVTVQRGQTSLIHSQHAEILDVADAGIAAYVQKLQGTWYYYETTPTISGTAGDGSFTVTATPPPSGSSTIRLDALARIPSQGLSRHVVAYVKPPSFADYAVVIDNPGANYSIGADATFWGKVHANGSVDNAGICNGTVSAVTAITGSGQFNGSPSKVCPADQIDFTTVTTDLSDIQTIATAQSAYFPPLGNWATGKPYLGYKVDFHGASFDVTKIRALSTTSTNSSTCWTLETSTTQANVSIPPSGTVFFDTEPIWVAGTYSKSVTIGDNCALSAGSNTVAGNSNSAVYCWNNLRPTDPSDDKQLMGIVTPGDISVPAWFAASPTSFTVQSALLSQYGSIHGDQANGANEARLDMIGSRAFKIQGGFSSSYDIRNFVWDDRFSRGIPPLFPRPVAYGGSALSLTSWTDYK
jgi:hypothetical protein